MWCMVVELRLEYKQNSENTHCVQAHLYGGSTPGGLTFIPEESRIKIP